LLKHVSAIVTNKEIYRLEHLLVILSIFDDARYKNKNRFCICCRFEINLQCGPNQRPKDDDALYVAPRFNEGYVARNSCEKDVWGRSERYGHMPVARGQGFEILIFCDQTHYKVSVTERLVPLYVWLYCQVQ
jgi:hypothetical protein